MNGPGSVLQMIFIVREMHESGRSDQESSSHVHPNDDYVTSVVLSIPGR
jgi:hypothetical protein